MSSPIADLSYRNYTGPKELSSRRWWAIARNSIRLSLKKKWFWVLATIAVLPYFFLMLFMFIAANVPEQASEILPDFKESLSSAFGNWYWLFFLALLVGSGSIASDNRANALQVYLSKPITKRDYLVGKWMGIFLVVFAVAFIPLVFVTLYQAFSIGIAEFIRQEPLLLPKLALVAALPACVHASMLVGISAWNKTPQIAGATYAAIYIFLNTAAIILGEVATDGLSPVAEQTVKSMSLQGAISGIAFNLIGDPPKGIQAAFNREEVLPYWQPLIAILVVACALGIYVAMKKIKAVEVVEG